jgi:YD repeat-containing protein
MVAIFVGQGAGFERGSGSVLGGAGLLGSALHGRGGEGVHVNAATGNLLLNRQDEFLVGRGPDSAVQRTYNSMAEAADDNGDQWRFGAQRRLRNWTGTINSAGSTVERVGADGAIVRYAYDAAASAYLTSEGAGARDKLVNSGSWLWTDGDSQLTETYDATGNLTQVSDTSGNSVTYTYQSYNGGQRLSRATTASGDYQDYVWTGENVTQVVTGYKELATNIDKTLTRVRYGYDASNRLTTVTTDLSPGDSSIADGKTYVTSYTYDGSSKRVATIGQSDGSQLAITYDSAGRVTSIAETVASGDVRTTALNYGETFTSVTAPDGQVTRLDYATPGAVVSGALSQWGYSNTSRTAVGPVDGSEAYQYSVQTAGQWAAIALGFSATVGDAMTMGLTLRGVGSNTTAAVGLNGNVSSWGLAAQSSARIVSGPGTLVRIDGGFWRVDGLSTTQATRIEITRTYSQTEAAGVYIYPEYTAYATGKAIVIAAPTLVRLPTASALTQGRQLTKITAPAATAGGPQQVIQFGYDTAGNLTSVIDAAGQTTTHAYDANGNAVQSTDRVGNIVSRTFGAKNQLLTETRTASAASGAAVSQTTRYAYDSQNRLRFTVSAEGHVTEYVPDAFGQNYWTVAFAQAAYDISGLASNQAISDYDLHNWKVTFDQKRSQISQLGFDARGNVTDDIGYGQPGSSYGSGGYSQGYSHTSSRYDQSGQLLQRWDAAHNVETYIYDGLGRMVAATDVNGGTTSYVFNDAATTTTVTLASGYVTTSTYNKAGNLLGATDASTWSPSGTTSYLYDKIGRMRVATDQFGRKSYVVYDKAGQKVADVNAWGDTTEYRYDINGRLAATTRYGNRLTAAQLTTLGNPDSQFDFVTMRPAAHQYDVWNWSIYDAAGRTSATISGDGGVTTFAYDGADRLVLTRGYANKLSAAQLSAYRSASPTSVTLPAADPTRDAIVRAFYDRDGRALGSLDGEGYITRAVYDKVGQRVQQTAFANATGSAATVDRATASFNQLIASVTASAADRTQNFVFDGMGYQRYAVDAHGYVTEFVYAMSAGGLANGPLRRTTSHAVSISTSDFSLANVSALVAANASNAANRSSWAVSDTAGRIAYAIDAEGAVTGFTYDNRGQVTRTIAFATKRATTSLPSESEMNSWRDANIGNTANRVSRTWYTTRGEARFDADAEGYVTGRDFYANGQLYGQYRFNTAGSYNDTSSTSDVYNSTAADASNSRYQVEFNDYRPDGRVYTHTNGIGVVAHYDYHASGQLAGIYADNAGVDASTQLFGYDQAGQQISRSDASGSSAQQQSAQAFDGLGLVVSTTDPAGGVTAFTYDRAGHVKTQTDALGGVTSYEYNAFGEVVKITDPRSNASYTYYDRLGRVVATRDAANYVTTTRYSEWSEVVETIRYYTPTTSAASSTAIPSVIANPLDALMTYSYDKLGRVISAMESGTYSDNFTYTAFGQVATKTNKLGGVTSYTYDRRGLMRTETVQMSTYLASGTLQSASATTRRDYDARGNVTQLVEAEGLAEQRTTNYTYDAADRLVSTQRNVLRADTSGLNVVDSRVDTIKYDRRGNVIETVNALGARTLAFYDDLDRKTVEINALGTYSAHSYDAAGNIASTRVYESTVTLPANGGRAEIAPTVPAGGFRETTFTYDALNRLLTSSISGVTTGAWNGSAYVTTTGALTTAYLYDAAGNVIRVTDPNGNATFRYYDALGRKTAEVDGAGYVTTWGYDNDTDVLTETRFATQFTGTPTTATAPTVTTHADDRTTDYSYDKFGNRTTESRRNVAVHNGSGGYQTVSATVTYAYNGLGQVVARTEATGDITSFFYDASGRLFEERRAALPNGAVPTVQYYYDAPGNLVRSVQLGAGVDAPARTMQYNFGAGGVLNSVIDAAGYTTQVSTDLVGRETGRKLTHNRGDGRVITTFDTTYLDALGRASTHNLYEYDAATGWDWTVTMNTTYYNTFGEQTTHGGDQPTSMQYDAAGRVSATTSGDGVWKYFGYDANGNQTITITSAGENLSGLTFAQALAKVGQENVTATYSVYDKRGLATDVIEEGRRLSAGGALETLTTTRAFNAFGETLAETNALGSTVNYTYNTAGKLTKSESPSVTIVTAAGVAQALRPTELFYYDAAGRLTAQRDANGGLTKRTLLAGTGYAGTDAQVVTETHADGGVRSTSYDIHGDARSTTDEVGRVTTRSYDARGLMTQVNNAGGLVENFTYDGRGQQVARWTSLYGAADKELTDYDAAGRVVFQRAIGGDTTTTVYDFVGAITTPGMSQWGGWRETTTYANGRTSVEDSDAFGRMVSKTDMGGNVTTYSYDAAARMVSSSVGGLATSVTYYSTGLQAGSSGAAGVAVFTYDKLGQRIGETLTVSGVLRKNQSATYDALGRLKSWAEAGTTTLPVGSTSWDYDANGNIRRVQSSFRNLDAAGVASGTPTTKEDWFAFDSMNRLVIDKGSLINGQIVRDADASELLYDTAGQRIQRLNTVQGKYTDTYYVGYTFLTRQVDYTGVGREDYTYDDAGRLTQIKVAAPVTPVDDNSYTQSNFTGSSATPATGPTRSTFTYDLIGRQTGQTDYESNGTTVAFSRSATYNARNQLLSDDSTSVRARTGAAGFDSYRTITRSDYDADGDFDTAAGTTYALGSVVWSHAQAYKNGIDGDATDTLTRNSYAFRDGAVTTGITHDTDYGWTANWNAGTNALNTASFDTNFTTTYALNAAGQLTGATIADGRPRSIAFINDENGQIIRRDESGSIAGQSGNPHEIWYRFAGRELGYIGNNGTSAIDTSASIAERQSAAPATNATGTFRGGRNVGGVYTDFAKSYDPLSSYNQGSGAGTYTVSAGETLSSIARSLYGDASLWYKLAQANGLATDASLPEGRTLVLPAGVIRAGFNASSITPYDPGSAIGDTSPTNAKPPRKNKCAVVGQLLLAVVAIAVTAIAAGPLGTALGSQILGGAAAGAAASTVSQAVGVATGIQSKFSFKGVALAAISGGVGGGIGGNVNLLSKGALGSATNVGNAIARGALGNAFTQGLSIATGLQDKFSFAGVAAAGIAAGVGSALGGALDPISGGKSPDRSLGNIAAHSGRATASLLASAATRSALEGSSFGANIKAGLPDVLAQTLVDSAVGLAGRGGSSVRAVADGGTRGEAAWSGGTNPAYLSNEALAARLELDYQSGLDFWTTGLPTLPAGITLVQSQASAHDAIGAVLRSERMQREAVASAGDIVVTARRSAVPARAMSTGVGDIDPYSISSGADWNGFYRQESGSASLGTYLQRNHYIGGADRNGAYADQLIEQTDYFVLRRMALPALRAQSETIADLRSVVARLDAHFDQVDATAVQQLDRPLMYGIAGLTLTAATGGVGTAAFAGTGTSGIAFVGGSAGIDGLAGASGGVLIREGLGQENSLRTFGTDFVLGGALSGLFRGGALALETRALSRANASGVAGSLIDDAHVAEMIENSVSFSRGNLLATGRSTSTGQIVFLETGGRRAGLQHIIIRHGEDFARIGVSESQIPEVVMRAATEGRLVGYQGRDQGRAIYEILLRQQPQRIAVTIGDNGFIVGANPAGRVR